MKTLRGIIQGNTIQLNDVTGFADGTDVEIRIRPLRPSHPSSAGLQRADFTYNEVLDLWIALVEFRRQKIEVRLYCRNDDDFSILASRALGDLESHWEPIRNAIVSELLPSYNQESDQALTADEFFSRLVLQTIDFDARDVMYRLFWSDSGLFGGHSIKVLWDPAEEFHARVSLVG